MPVAIPQPFRRPASFNIGPLSWEAMGRQLLYTAQLSSTASTVWPGANRGIFYPFTLSEPRTVKQMWCYNGSAVAGSIDMGVYTAAGARLVNMGNGVSQATTSDLQYLDVTDTVLPPFVTLYAGLALTDASTATVTCMVASSSLSQYRASGVVQMASAYSSGLVASATFATLTTNTLPLFGMVFASTI